MTDLTFLPAVFMAEQVRKKKISPAELIEAHLAQIEKLNPRLNAFAQVDAERARRAALDAESEVMHGETLGPLQGVPVSIKSALAVAGMRCESGTRLRAGFVPAQDKEYLIAFAQLPNGATLDRTEAVMRELSDIALAHAGCAGVDRDGQS